MKRRTKLILGFTLLILLASIGFAAIAVSTNDSVEAILHVVRDESETSSETEEGFQRHKRMLAELVKSNFVVTAALRKNDISSLPIIRQQSRPVHWLTRQLKVDLDPDSELIFVRISTRWRNTEDLTRILNQVVATFEVEIVNKERLDKVDRLTKLRRRYSSLYDTVKKKADEVAKLEAVFGVGEAKRLERRRLESRLDQLYPMLVQLELSAIREKANSKSNQPSVVGAQIDYIREHYETLSKELEKYGGTPGEVVARRGELKALQRDLLITRKQMNALQIHLDGPDRVSVIQEAMSMREIRRLEDSF